MMNGYQEHENKNGIVVNENNKNEIEINEKLLNIEENLINKIIKIEENLNDIKNINNKNFNDRRTIAKEYIMKTFINTFNNIQNDINKNFQIFKENLII